MTAHAIKGDREICLKAGMDAYLFKPLRADELFQAIESLVAGGRLAAPTHTSGVARDAVFDEPAFLSRMDGSYEVCVQIAEAFFVECPKLMSDLRLALKRKDAAELAALAHAIKGTIANFTDGAAFQCAARLEQLAKEADLYRAAETFKRLESDLEALLQSLRSFVNVVPKA